MNLMIISTLLALLGATGLGMGKMSTSNIHTPKEAYIVDDNEIVELLRDNNNFTKTGAVTGFPTYGYYTSTPNYLVTELTSLTSAQDLIALYGGTGGDTAAVGFTFSGIFSNSAFTYVAGTDTYQLDADVIGGDGLWPFAAQVGVGYAIDSQLCSFSYTVFNRSFNSIYVEPTRLGSTDEFVISYQQLGYGLGVFSTELNTTATYLGIHEDNGDGKFIAAPYSLTRFSFKTSASFAGTDPFTMKFTDYGEQNIDDFQTEFGDLAYDEGLQDGLDSDTAYAEGYADGLASAEGDFYTGLEDWIVPAIIAVILLGGGFSVWLASRKRD